jgi:cation diffusion facilitator CzcD-associated flavoprotein CzcO
MNGKNGGLDKNARIVIVGAGPAGLSTAWFLHKHGFDNVTVIERLGRIGGLCKSLTVDGMSYDLGAPFIQMRAFANPPKNRRSNSIPCHPSNRPDSANSGARRRTYCFCSPRFNRKGIPGLTNNNTPPLASTTTPASSTQ